MSFLFQALSTFTWRHVCIRLFSFRKSWTQLNNTCAKLVKTARKHDKKPMVEWTKVKISFYRFHFDATFYHKPGGIRNLLKTPSLFRGLLWNQGRLRKRKPWDFAFAQTLFNLAEVMRPHIFDRDVHTTTGWRHNSQNSHAIRRDDSETLRKRGVINEKAAFALPNDTSFNHTTN